MTVCGWENAAVVQQNEPHGHRRFLSLDDDPFLSLLELFFFVAPESSDCPPSSLPPRFSSFFSCAPTHGVSGWRPATESARGLTWASQSSSLSSSSSPKSDPDSEASSKSEPSSDEPPSDEALKDEPSSLESSEPSSCSRRAGSADCSAGNRRKDERRPARRGSPSRPP